LRQGNLFVARTLDATAKGSYTFSSLF
jgi:hypothetical protein